MLLMGQNQFRSLSPQLLHQLLHKLLHQARLPVEVELQIACPKATSHNMVEISVNEACGKKPQKLWAPYTSVIVHFGSAGITIFFFHSSQQDPLSVCFGLLVFNYR